MTQIILLMLALQLNVTEPQMMRTTCYTWTGNRTASGVYPEYGMCASNYEHMGDIAVVYDLDMNLIDTFVVTDVGGAPSLKNGTSIDIYQNSLSECYEWVATYGDYLYIRWIDGDSLNEERGNND